jgi:hypothetical protein
MSHPAALEAQLANVRPADRPPEEIERAWSAGLAEEVSKAVALVCLDGQPRALVHCWTGLYFVLAEFFEALPGEKYGGASIVWMPCGDPGTEVCTLYLTRDLWEAFCETEEKFLGYMQSKGFIEADDGHD